MAPSKKLPQAEIDASVVRLVRPLRKPVELPPVVPHRFDSKEHIEQRIQRLYLQLHRLGFAHSVEVWEGDALVGGVYGVTLGAAFFGESMFSRRTDASKVALAYAVHRLRAGGFRLFDTQFLTPHLASLGAREIPRAEYQRLLADALAQTAEFDPPGYSPSAGSVAGSAAAGAASGRTQVSTQTS